MKLAIICFLAIFLIACSSGSTDSSSTTSSTSTSSSFNDVKSTVALSSLQLAPVPGWKDAPVDSMQFHPITRKPNDIETGAGYKDGVSGTIIHDCDDATYDTYDNTLTYQIKRYEWTGKEPTVFLLTSRDKNDLSLGDRSIFSSTNNPTTGLSAFELHIMVKDLVISVNSLLACDKEQYDKAFFTGIASSLVAKV